MRAWAIGKASRVLIRPQSPPCDPPPHPMPPMSTQQSALAACTYDVDKFIPSSIRRKYSDLESLMCQQFQWTQARPFQVIGGLLQLARCDAMIHSGTGSGKTAVVAVPYSLKENQRRCTIFISPLIVLQSEMVSPGFDA